jgi:hypothetical protein
MKKETNPILEAALEYAKMGFSVIPIRPGAEKNPFLDKWKKYQTERASGDQIKKWFEEFPEANVGVITGAVSGIMVVDVDKEEIDVSLPPTAISKTGRGWHFIYKHPGGKISCTKAADKIDIKGDGGYVVFPPSIHHSGKKYEWAFGSSLKEVDPAELPRWIFQQTSKNKKDKVDWDKKFHAEVLEGSRNMTAAQIIGKLLYHLPVEMWEMSGWATLKEWNCKCSKPPLREDELRKTFESIQKREMQRRQKIGRDGKAKGRKQSSDAPDEKKPTQAEMLIKLVEESEGLELFHDEHKKPYAHLTVEDHQEIWPCKGEQFKNWLSRLMWDKYGIAPNPNTLTTALGVIKAKALFKGKRYDLSNRVALCDGFFWYDLSDEKCRAVKINDQKWEIDPKPPILFKRYSHHEAQIEPATQSGDPKIFLDFVNISDKNQKLLLLVYIIACFIPDFPHPIINIYGVQGSAKSTLSKLLRKIIDPSVIEVSNFPKEPAEIIQKLSHNWFICFDNVSYISGSISDLLCRAVTGMGFSKRELFSDDDDFVYRFKRCIGLNGINLVAERPDLLERSILLELEVIPKEKRKTEKEVLEQFEAARPAILGGIFDALVKTLAMIENVKLTSSFRMADFTHWGCAIAEALGYQQTDFLFAYGENIEMQNRRVLHDSLVAMAIIELMDRSPNWEGTAAVLLKKIKEIAELQEVDVKREKSFPKAANALSREMKKLEPNLAEAGIIFSREKGRKQRIIKIKKVAANIVFIDESSQDEDRKDDNDINVDDIPM